MLEEGIPTSTEPLAALKNPEYLARAANRHHQKKRPAEPSDLDFQISEDHIPADFLQSDVTVHGRRHLIFATENMLHLLRHGMLMEHLKWSKLLLPNCSQSTHLSEVVNAPSKSLLHLY